MTEKKTVFIGAKTNVSVDVESITDSNRLEFLNKSLHLLFNTPAGVNPLLEFAKSLYRYVPFDSFLCYVHTEDNATVRNGLQKTLKFGNHNYKYGMDAKLFVKEISGKEVFTMEERMLELRHDHMQESLQNLRTMHPERTLISHHYHPVRALDDPECEVGFYRFHVSDKVDQPFTENDKAVFALFTKEITNFVRLHVALQKLENGNLAVSFLQVCDSISERYELTTAETKIMIEMLRGFTNEEIAERSFVSVPTVKTHIQHVLKKTNTRSRADFFGRFFLDPERSNIP